MRIGRCDITNHEEYSTNNHSICNNSKHRARADQGVVRISDDIPVEVKDSITFRSALTPIRRQHCYAAVREDWAAACAKGPQRATLQALMARILPASLATGLHREDFG